MISAGRAMRIAAWVAVAAIALLASPARAAEPIEIFDAHLHYNWEPKPYYQLEDVLALFRKNRVTGILATSRPNTGTHDDYGRGTDQYGQKADSDPLAELARLIGQTDPFAMGRANPKAQPQSAQRQQAPQYQQQYEPESYEPDSHEPDSYEPERPAGPPP